MEKNVYIRVGEKNNFNFTLKELTELKKYEDKGKIFVNSNSFIKVKNNYPSIITINPNMIFNPLPIDSDFSNIKAFRVKYFYSDNDFYTNELLKCMNYSKEKNIPILLTFFRSRSKKTCEKLSLHMPFYEWKNNYFRIKKDIKKDSYSRFEKSSKFYVCDKSGKGCTSCNNCTKITYNKIGIIKALNLSISGIKDKRGKQGLCKFNCIDCFAKIVTYGYSPSCNKLITNKKILGKVNNN